MHSPTHISPVGFEDVNNDYGFARSDDQLNNNNRLAIRYVVEDARYGVN
jgi:hypothetical protein